MDRFRLSIETLSEQPEVFRFEATPGWWASWDPEPGGRDPLEVEEPFHFVLDARRIGEDVAIEGRMEARVALECSRCARRYSHALRDGFRLVLEPAGEREPMDPEGVAQLAETGLWLGEELESGWFRGSRIGLDGFFGEVIALAIPIQPLCREDCPGICPHCGVDRAQTHCDCEDQKVDSPFAVLAKLKDRGVRDEPSDA